MNIAQALKQKNRLAGKIKDLENKIQTSNVYNDRRQKQFDTVELNKQLTELRVELIDLKTRLSKANVGICGKLVELSEAKAEISFWNNLLHYTDVSERVETTYLANGTPVNINFYSQISRQEASAKLDELQTKIDTLQDEVDAYNATTKI